MTNHIVSCGSEACDRPYCVRLRSEAGSRNCTPLCVRATKLEKMDAKLCVALSVYEHHTHICEYVVHLDINV